MTSHDRRLHAFRPDLADLRLKGAIAADRFVEGRPAVVIAPVADVRRAPDAKAPLDTQFLRGDIVRVFDQAEGFAWVQAERDGYVGYVALSDLGEAGKASTHVVSAPRTFVYPGPDLRFPRSGMLSMGSGITVAGYAETRGTRYALLGDGTAIVAVHLVSVGTVPDDYVAVAERLIHTPYLWGGVSGFGIDCSGVVQLAKRMAGFDVPRDSDMQANGLGAPLDIGPDFSGLRRGDLVFWKGHVAIMTDPDTMIHANGHTMTVEREGLRDAVTRIGYLYGGPTGFRRP